MVLYNHTYKDLEELEAFIKNNDISKNVLIQIFSSNNPKELLISIKEKIKFLLPQSSLIATTTAGIVNEGTISDNEIIISFSNFESSTVTDIGYFQKKINEIISDLKNHITDKTKLIISFANTFRFDSSGFLEEMNKNYPDIVLVGGNAGDDFLFKECTVISSNNHDCDVAFAIIDSDVLKINTEYLFNWETVGRSMLVTKSKDNIVFEVDNKPVVEVYEYYLGKLVRDNLLEYGIEFPLVFEENGTTIARALVAYNEKDGSITFAGNVPEGKKVRFGYANINHIEFENSRYLYLNNNSMNEAMYIYTCGSRRQMLGNFLNKELQALNSIGKSIGFITYGEFFHNIYSCKNDLLNITTTFITLNENTNQKLINSQINLENKISKEDIRVSALSTLLKQTSEELDENIFYLEQFKKSVDEVAIFSTSNEKGIITDINQNFEKISGYSREELIGKPHNIVRHPDMPKEIFKNMWSDIKSGKIWKGTVKNKSKNGKPYYVLTEISPIYNKDGSLKEYIGIRNDITELEEYKEVLKSELNLTKVSLEEQLCYVKQYEEAVNNTVAILKTNKDNIITYANKTFCELIKYDLSELIGKNCSELKTKNILKKALVQK